MELMSLGADGLRQLGLEKGITIVSLRASGPFAPVVKVNNV